MIKCTLSGCNLKHSARGLCKKHYMREYFKTKRLNGHAHRQQTMIEKFEQLLVYAELGKLIAGRMGGGGDSQGIKIRN